MSSLSLLKFPLKNRAKNFAWGEAHKEFRRPLRGARYADRFWTETHLCGTKSAAFGQLLDKFGKLWLYCVLFGADPTGFELLPARDV
jgi:hypothetical protein